MMMTQKGKSLLEWMESGDRELVPVVMADARSTAASYLGMPLRTEGSSASFTESQESLISPDLVLQCSRETGIHFLWNLGDMTPLDVIEFMEEVETAVREETASNGDIRKFVTFRTPAGELSEVFITPRDKPACWSEHFIKTDADLPALSYLIEKATQVCLEDDRVRVKMTEKLKAEADKWPGYVPLYATLGIPAFMLSSNLFVDPAGAFYLMADHRCQMERLYEAYAQCNSIWVQIAARAGADFIMGAINGLELFSPEIYQRYFVPQARKLHDHVHECGMKTWVHTCGYMRRLIDMGVYEPMGVDVLESFSHPPLGDVTELGQARRRLGRKIVTRGGVNVSLFYEDSSDSIRERTKRVLAETRGYPHMIGDTNDSFPLYPRENILAVVEEVEKSGRMLKVRA